MAEINDANKRKEPEPAEGKQATEPETKRLKATSADPAAVKKQVEYYMSDDNLRRDKFFHDKISADKEGWLDMDLILTCNKMKAMRASKEDVLAALKDSKLELKEGAAAVRRPGNAVLPTLEERPQHPRKNSLHSHDGGVMAVMKNIPEEQSCLQVKEKLKDALPPKANLWFVSEVSDRNMCFVATAPFDGDAQFFDELQLDLGGSKIRAELCQGDSLQQGLKLLPKHIRERREKESRKRQKERNKPIQVGTQKFVNVGALRGRVKEILNSRTDGEQLKPEGSDFKLIKGLLEFHPKGPGKSEGMKGIKVAQSTQGENRCFFMIKGDDTVEDFSAKKCLDAIEANPPYVKTESSMADAVQRKPAAATAEEVLPKPATAVAGEVHRKPAAATAEEA